MKKNFIPAVKKTAKSAFALSLAATMTVPAGVAFAEEEKTTATDAATTATATGESAVPTPIKTIDFTDGLKAFEGDDNFAISYTEDEIYTMKSGDQLGSSDLTDANNLVYQGEAGNAHYVKQAVANQPTTAYDEEKGTVLKIGKSQTVPAMYKTKSASEGNSISAETAAKLDEEVPVAETAIQKAYTANSEIVISNPFGSKELREELTEYSEYDNPIEGVTWTNKYIRQRYQPIWNKGLTLSYWIKVPSDEEGNYKPSSVLRWELDDQLYYQVDDYAKHLACAYFDVEQEQQKASYDAAEYEAAVKKEESGVLYGSAYYFKYASDYVDGTDENGAPKAALYAGKEGYEGPVYDARFVNADEAKTGNVTMSAYYQFNQKFIRGYYQTADGTMVAQLSELVGSHTKNYYSQYYSLDMKLDPENPDAPSTDPNASMVRRAMEDGEMQIDTDNSIFWVPDNNLGINLNPNATTSYKQKAGMHNADCFFVNSWQDGSEKDAAGNFTYQSAKRVALSPVSSLDEEGTEGAGIKNGNCDKWHQVTVTLQNDWVEFYVDGVKSDVENNYSMRGQSGLKRDRSFKRLNKGTGLRGGYGSEKGAINFSYGNYVARLFMDWMTDEEATLHIGGAGDYANEYAQATQSCEFSIDDIKFYGQLLTEEQIVAAYDAEAKQLPANAKADTYGTFADLKTITDASIEAEKATAGTVTIEGKSVDSVKVAENAKAKTSTAAQIKSPFAGKNIDGATIGFWVKQDNADKSSVISFIDTAKEIVSAKTGANGEASSILYIQSDGTADYTEGYSDSELCGKLKNTFYTSVSSSAVSTKSILEKAAADWQYVTVTVNNGGIKYYINGEPVESATVQGPRFLDGYYQRVQDEEDPKCLNGLYGGTNNQGATTLMSFLTAEDTTIYLGALPESGSDNFYKTAGATFAGLKTVDAALTDAQVKEFYTHRFEAASNSEVEAGSGDIDGNGVIDLQDVQLALQMYLKIAKDLSDAAIAAADVDGNGVVDLSDAQKILQTYLKK